MILSGYYDKSIPLLCPLLHRREYGGIEGLGDPGKEEA